MNKCYLVGAGDFFGMPTPDGGDLVIAADGGYNHLISHGLRCDLLIGDLDSLVGGPPEIELIRHPVKKDMTDMYLAYLEGVRRGYTEFEIYGASGGREDHTLANYSLLLYAREQGNSAALYSKNACARVIKNESVIITGTCGKTLSVFAFGKDALGVDIIGAEYEALGVNLSMSFPLGVSNSFKDEPVTISVRDGALLIISEI